MHGYGTLYGIGVGPGDPELMTIKAQRIISEARVIAVPGEKKEETMAYQIASQVIEHLDEKNCLELKAPMTKEKKTLDAVYSESAREIGTYLRKGLDVAFLTLGDPTVYSTYMYLHKKVQELGFPVQIISGVTSFCAAAARMNLSLAEQNQQIHICPSCYDIKECLKEPGTKILMKSGSKIQDVKKELIDSAHEVVMVEKCGLKDEKIYQSAEEIDDDAGYFSLIIAKEKKTHG
ncbi:MAG: precorrin-2 C(20)-methyltransferase [Eubacterium sp.]|nr:precorrin-2 C(20)-methyltransferase [Eubacterium sp.]